jgi:hypothetical protein
LRRQDTPHDKIQGSAKGAVLNVMMNWCRFKSIGHANVVEELSGDLERIC